MHNLSQTDSDDQDIANIPPANGDDCDENEKSLMLWQMDSLLQFKSEFETILSKEFDDDFFLKSIQKLYPIIRHKSPKPKHIQSRSRSDIKPQPRELTLFRETYELSTESKFTHSSFVPVKIDYFLFNPSFNWHFRTVLYHQCIHNLVSEQPMSSFQFTSNIMNTMRTQIVNVGYTTKLQYELCDTESASQCSTTTGCCMECAALLTPQIIIACKVIKDMNYQYNPNAKVPLPMHIDGLWSLCIWIGNILQHKYIKQCLKNDSDIMPTMLLAVYTLMISAHQLYKDKVKLYKNRRNIISYAIFTALKQILLNHDYIEMYYQSVDDDRDQFCEGYILQMVEWMMEELRIVSEVSKGRKNSVSVMRSLDHDYLGCIVVLMSLLSEYRNTAVRGLTCQCPVSLDSPQTEFVMDFWMTMHRISHNTEQIGKFFAGSIRRCKDLKNLCVIGCQWRKCRKWKNANKFYKCKKCKAVSYCSRHCQKKDWIYGSHCMICAKY